MKVTWAEDGMHVGEHGMCRELAFEMEAGDENIYPGHVAQLAAWIIEAPDRHPVWHSYLGTLTTLVELEALGPTHKNFPAATHEIIMLALNPEHPYEAPILGTDEMAPAWPFHYLTPPNVVAHFVCTSDDIAGQVGNVAAVAVADGRLAIEPGGAMLSRYWEGSLALAVEHYVTGGHHR